MLTYTFYDLNELKSQIKEISKLLTKFGYKKYYNKNGN